MRTYIQAEIHSYTPLYKHIKHTHVHICICIYTQAYTQSYIHLYMYASK